MMFLDRFWIGTLCGFVAGAVVTATVSLYMLPPPTVADEVGASAGLEIPTPQEADAAFKRAKSDQWSLRLGTCSTNTSGPGVMCAVDFKQRPDGPTRQGVVGFARAPSGWMATHYY